MSVRHTFGCLLAVLCLSVTLSEEETDYTLTAEQRAAFTKYNITVEEETYKLLLTVGLLPPPDQRPFPPMVPPPEAHKVAVPLKAQELDTPGCVNQGLVGVAINGVPIFMPYDQNGYEYSQNSIKNCSGIVDQDNNIYFYPRIPTCLLNDIKSGASSTSSKYFVGVALDGYPIYVSENVTNLDQCNFRDDDDDEDSGYYLTDKFPYTLGCFHGKVLENPPDGTKCVYANVTAPNGWDDLQTGDISKYDTTSIGSRVSIAFAAGILSLMAFILSI